MFKTFEDNRIIIQYIKKLSKEDMYLNTLQRVQFHQHDTIEVKTKNSTKKMKMLNQQYNGDKDDERFGGEDGKRLKGGRVGERR
jgi:hypothetical protein